jgi:hypothetical protein
MSAWALRYTNLRSECGHDCLPPKEHSRCGTSRDTSAIQAVFLSRHADESPVWLESGCSKHRLREEEHRTSIGARGFLSHDSRGSVDCLLTGKSGRRGERQVLAAQRRMAFCLRSTPSRRMSFPLPAIQLMKCGRSLGGIA